jgi:Rrf2 family transcriptional regulator, iron-sulfur cluster assembly transcription factor
VAIHTLTRVKFPEYLSVSLGIDKIPTDSLNYSENSMRLTTKGRFAVTAMIDLGLRQDKGPVTLAAISQRQKISLSYLEQLFGRLRRHELVESMRGPGGGYKLARDGKDITVADIIYAVDEPLDATQCGGKQNCHEDQQCMTHELWASLNRHMVDFLDSVSLQDLVEEQRNKRGVSVAADAAPIRRHVMFQEPRSIADTKAA